MSLLRVEIAGVGRNTEVVASLLRERGLDLVAVTKGCCAEPRVAAAMLEGGAVALADTRDRNLRRLRGALPKAEIHRIHLPSLAGHFEAGDITYVSSEEGASALAALGGTRRRRRVMVMVETGDLREGVPLQRLEELAHWVAEDPKLEFVGVATNYACFQGTSEGVWLSVVQIAEAAQRLQDLGMSVRRVSAGNSSVLALLIEGRTLPAGVTELRCGEALLLGHDALYHRPIPGCIADACVIRAEVLERYTKRTDTGVSCRVVLGVGRQDLALGEVRFVDPCLHEVGRSADYLIAELRPEIRGIRVGTMVDMIPSYEALVAAWTSPYVELKLVGP